MDHKYTSALTEDEWYRFSALGGDLRAPDTGLETLLALHYSAEIAKIRPAKADKILPPNTKSSDLKIGAAVFQDLQILRFLGDTRAVGAHEDILKFITDFKRVTRAEVEKYYRDGIRGFVAEIVNEEFNKVSFLMSSPTGGYNAVLMRDPQNNGSNTLKYTDARDNTKELSAQTLSALTSAMSKRPAEFNQDSVNELRAQAVLIPAVNFSISVRDDIVNVITAFFINPNNNTASEVRLKHENLWRTDGDKGKAAASTLFRSMNTINRALANRILN
jgi:hypothetical protein